jgi:hypothetical protein
LSTGFFEINLHAQFSSENSTSVEVGKGVAVRVKVEVGIIKMIVAVGEGVSVDVLVGNKVIVGVWVGGGKISAVCVRAATTVRATLVPISPGIGVGAGEA